MKTSNIIATLAEAPGAFWKREPIDSQLFVDAIQEYEHEQRKIMTDLLEQQLVNELRSLIKPINEKYKDFFHIPVITLCDMKEMSCDECKASEFGQKCRRCIVGFEAFVQQ